MKSDRIMEKKTNITEKDLSLFLGNQGDEIDDENMTQTKAQSAPNLWRKQQLKQE